MNFFFLRPGLFYFYRAFTETLLGETESECWRRKRKTRLHCRTGTPKYTKRRKGKGFFSLFFLNPFFSGNQSLSNFPFLCRWVQSLEGVWKIVEKIRESRGEIRETDAPVLSHFKPRFPYKRRRKRGPMSSKYKKNVGNGSTHPFSTCLFTCRKRATFFMLTREKKDFPNLEEENISFDFNSAVKYFPFLSEYWTHTAAVFFPKKDLRRREKPLPL